MPVKIGHGKRRCHRRTDVGVLCPGNDAEFTALLEDFLVGGQRCIGILFFRSSHPTKKFLAASHHGLEPSQNFPYPLATVERRIVDGTSSTTNCRAQRGENHYEVLR